MSPQAERSAQTYVIRFRAGESQKIIADEVIIQPKQFIFYHNKTEVARYIIDTIVGYHVSDDVGTA